MTDRPTADQIPALAAELEPRGAAAIVEWAVATYGDGVVFTASFEDAALIDVVAQVAPTLDVVLLDTQYLFAETEWYAEALRQRYQLNLRVVTPDPRVVRDNRWQHDVEGCCGVRKVEPLNRVLAEKDAWITGIRRADAPTRAHAPVIEFDVARDVVKVNPLAAWTDQDIDNYIDAHQLLRHPLTDRGYASIGCWPCTRPVAPGEDRRAGRWAGLDKTECGLHVVKGPV
ncbi:MAG: phosphoadenylyl-sulfate reductase [Acidimicrobiia bacterium]